MFAYIREYNACKTMIPTNYDDDDNIPHFHTICTWSLHDVLAFSVHIKKPLNNQLYFLVRAAQFFF